MVVNTELATERRTRPGKPQTYDYGELIVTGPRHSGVDHGNRPHGRPMGDRFNAPPSNNTHMYSSTYTAIAELLPYIGQRAAASAQAAPKQCSSNLDEQSV
jgi:hypothetical protein